MWELIQKIRPPGYTKKNRGAVYRLVGRVTQRIADDATQALHAFFPLPADSLSLARHAAALSIPHYPFDSEDEFRRRVASAAFYLERRGQRGFTREIISRLVPDRFSILEYPKDGFRVGYSALGHSPLGGGYKLYVKVRGLTSQEESWIYTFLDDSLDPDIEISVTPWVHHPVSPAAVSLLRKLGGSAWIEKQLEDIASLTVELLPDDGLRVGYAALGHARIIPGTDPLVIVTVEDPSFIPALEARLEAVLDDAIERRCV